jgi:hypothetical protein
VWSYSSVTDLTVGKMVGAVQATIIRFQNRAGQIVSKFGNRAFFSKPELDRAILAGAALKISNHRKHSLDPSVLMKNYHDLHFLQIDTKVSLLLLCSTSS